MDPEYGIPGLGTYAAAGWGGSSQTEATYSPPSADATHAAELAIASARHVGRTLLHALGNTQERLAVPRWRI